MFLIRVLPEQLLVPVLELDGAAEDLSGIGGRHPGLWIGQVIWLVGGANEDGSANTNQRQNRALDRDGRHR